MKHRESGLPFDDIRQLVQGLPDIDQNAVEITKKQVDPSERLTQLAIWYAAWSGRTPQIHRPLLALFAGTHGLETELEGDSHAAPLYEAATTLAQGSDWLNRVCSQEGFGLKLFDLALQLPVSDIRKEAALDEKMCAGTIGFGMESIAGGTDLLCLSAIEGRVPHATMAILTALELPVTAVPGQDEALFKKLGTRQMARRDDPLEVLRRLGGREISALMGAMLAARTQHIPAVISGWTAMAGLAVLWKLNPQAVSHCVLAQAQDETMDELAHKLSIPVVHTTRVTHSDPIAAILAASAIRAAGLMCA